MANLGERIRFKSGPHHGKTGVTTEIVDPICSVRLDDAPTKPDGTPADHAHDTIGCVPVADVEAVEASDAVI